MHSRLTEQLVKEHIEQGMATEGLIFTLLLKGYTRGRTMLRYESGKVDLEQPM